MLPRMWFSAAPANRHCRSRALSLRRPAAVKMAQAVGRVCPGLDTHAHNRFLVAQAFAFGGP
jgi:hypothetical protein